MKVLIAGGTGLVGRALSASLSGDGHSVSVLSRSARSDSSTPQGVTLVRWDAATPNGWERELATSDALVNLVGENLGDSPWTDERKRRIRESRLRAGEAIVEGIRTSESKPSVLIQGSAVGYYGPRGDAPISEDEPAGGDFLASVCVDWESSTAPVEGLGVRRAITRTGLVMSADGGSLPRIVLPAQLFVGGQVGDGRQYFPWVHLADEVRAIRFLIERADASGPFNLVAPQTVTNAEFSEALARVLGRPNLFPKPAFLMRALFGEMSTVVLTGQQAVPSRLLQAGFEFRYPTLIEALRALYR